MRLDAKGKQCPIPVIMAKKELDANTQDLEILVDGQAQIDNLARLGDSVGRPVTSEPCDGIFLVKFANGDTKSVDGDGSEYCNASANNTYAVFFNKDSVGSGSDELGLSLAKMAIFTLSESDKVPAYILFMNGGVKLTTGIEPQIVENLQTLIDKGTKVLVCGTCLNFFGVKDDMKVGTVSNMYDILGAMQEVGKVITL
ncbi:MAG: sulfurtransferase-like selenium metabolism protein YedF [Firmicutes bacterium]|nr:sulfurtransferase-like selenium metabolism protein YedF [Bacillota bacterium]